MGRTRANRVKGYLSGVLLSDLLDFDGVVGEEVVQHVEVEAALEGGVLPEDVEGEHLAVVLEVLVEPAVRVASSVVDLDVLLVLLLIRGRDLGGYMRRAERVRAVK